MDIADKRLNGIPHAFTLEELTTMAKPLQSIEITIEPTRLLPFQNYRTNQEKAQISIYPCAIGRGILGEKNQLYFYFLKSPDGKIGYLPQALDLQDID